MLWEHEPQAIVSSAFSSSPKVPRVFLYLDGNTVHVFYLLIKKFVLKHS